MKSSGDQRCQCRCRTPEEACIGLERREPSTVCSRTQPVEGRTFFFVRKLAFESLLNCKGLADCDTLLRSLATLLNFIISELHCKSSNAVQNERRRLFDLVRLLFCDRPRDGVGADCVSDPSVSFVVPSSRFQLCAKRIVLRP